MNGPAQQQGAVLIISLIVMVLLTSMGVAVMQGSVIEQKIANNQRDMNTAMAAAELAMQAAEEAILDRQNPMLWSDFEADNGNPGLYAETPLGADEPWEQLSTWSGNGSVVVNVSNTIYAQPPRYIIERIGEFEVGPSMTDKQTIRMVRVTAIGYGTSSKSRVMLQANYRWN
ncbi:MAG: hypothetical protein HUJ29_09600 [Gammaproteobacteria bacterium]|nr:hypothetical protein [Gammaproteobacteria bacterium]